MPLTRKRARDNAVAYLSYWPLEIGQIIVEYTKRTEEEKMMCLLADSGESIRMRFGGGFVMTIHIRSGPTPYLLEHTGSPALYAISFKNLLPSTPNRPQWPHFDEYNREMNRLLSRY